MDSETLRWLLTVFIGPAAAAIFIWWQKNSELRSEHSRKQLDSNQEFSESSQTNAFVQVFATQKELVAHIIESDNGRSTKLFDAVIEGDREHTRQLMEMTAAFNQLLVYFAGKPPLLGSKDNLEVMAAAVKSAAVKKTDEIVALASSKTE